MLEIRHILLLLLPLQCTCSVLQLMSNPCLAGFLGFSEPVALTVPIDCDHAFRNCIPVSMILQGSLNTTTLNTLKRETKETERVSEREGERTIRHPVTDISVRTSRGHARLLWTQNHEWLSRTDWLACGVYRSSALTLCIHVLRDPSHQYRCKLRLAPILANTGDVTRKWDERFRSVDSARAMSNARVPNPGARWISQIYYHCNKFDKFWHLSKIRFLSNWQK